MTNVSGSIYLIEGKQYRTCDCDPHTQSCPRGMKRELATAEFARCMSPYSDAIVVMSADVLVPTDAMLDAPRCFIMYCETPGRTLQGAREHMENCGDSIESWPKWAKEDSGHITKSGMASIIWHMMLAAHEGRSHE